MTSKIFSGQLRSNILYAFLLKSISTLLQGTLVYLIKGILLSMLQPDEMSRWKTHSRHFLKMYILFLISGLITSVLIALTVRFVSILFRAIVALLSRKTGNSIYKLTLSFLVWIKETFFEYYIICAL